MKRLLAALIFSVVFTKTAMCSPNITAQTKIGPASSTSQVTLPSAGTGKRNCLTNLDVVSDTAFNLSVADGGTTIYQLALPAAGGIVRSWDFDDGLCGSAATAMTISVSAGTYRINYKGFTY